jgi:ParB family chromosome partitioning protein
MSLDLDGLDRPLPSTTGAPLLLPVDSIDEDPEQPRKEFDAEALRELAETIKERGVRQPISVRPHPQQPGRWMLNFGARRLRASVLASCASIPAFVDETADTYDQVIENEQRQPLKALELALFVQRRLAAGESQADIARRIGKSRQYVTYATALIDAPDWLMTAYRESRCRGLYELYELRRLATGHAEQVEEWASRRTAISREHVQELRVALTDGSEIARAGAPANTIATPMSPRSRKPAELQQPHSGASLEQDEHPSTRHRLRAKLDGEVVEIETQRVPVEYGAVFIRRRGVRRIELVEASRLKLLGFAAG